jgi:hypothetical protein
LQSVAYQDKTILIFKQSKVMKTQLKNLKQRLSNVISGFSKFYITGYALLKRIFAEKSVQAKKLLKAEKITVWTIYREYRKKLVLPKGERLGRERFKVLLDSARETRKAILGAFVTGYIQFFEEKTKAYTIREIGCIKECNADYNSIGSGCLRFLDRVAGGIRCCKLENIERVLIVAKK